MRLLIIGNMHEQVVAASHIAKKRGAKVFQVPSIESALNALRSGQGADLVMIDVAENIKQFITSIDEEHISVPVVAYGINAKSSDAANAIKSGAKEYIPLPPDEALISAVFEAITEENNSVIYKSEAMKKILAMADQIAPSDANVLITGESGTGKEVIARYIHKKSKRADRPLISVNCAAIPDNLLESEMFGHEKGAFTGAVARRVGKFEEADNGTLLLDEISEMDIKLQAKLLRAVQEKVIDRVGGSDPVRLNVRFIATSNVDLKKAVADGKFREDLFFRLNIIHIHIPPLRERKEDIALFVKHFVKKYSENNGIAEKPISVSAMRALENNNWQGNVRELENTMHRAVLLATGNEIDENSIMTNGSSSAPSSSGANTQGLVGRTMESVERELIISTLDHCLGNRTHAANILGISIRTLRNKLKEYGKDEGGEETPKTAQK